MNVHISIVHSVSLTDLLSVNTNTSRSLPTVIIFVSLCVIGLRPVTSVPPLWQDVLYFSLWQYEYA